MKSMYPANESLMKISPATCDGACRMYGNQSYIQVSISASSSFFIVKPAPSKTSTSGK